jgi:hypothetical protein
MEASQVPTLVGVPWAFGAISPYIRTIPVPSQIGSQNGAASFTDGFPPWCFQPGGYPFGEDFNGILNIETLWTQWINAGGPINYNAAFSSAVGGYPQYALVASVSVPGAWWQSQVDNNTSDPDTGGANWVLCTMQQPYLDARYLRQPPAYTFYVNTSIGSDTLYDGTAAAISGSHGPWATGTHAAAQLALYNATTQVTVYFSSGTYAGIQPMPTISNWDIVGAGGAGNPYSSGTTTLSQLSTGANLGVGLLVVGANLVVTVSNITFASASNNVQSSVGEVFVNQCALSAPTNGVDYSILATNGAQINCIGASTYTGNGAGILYAQITGHLAIGAGATAGSIVCSGSPTFSGACAGANKVGIISLTNGTVSGTATGTRAASNLNSVVDTGGHGQTGFAGNANGTGTNGGQIQ